MRHFRTGNLCINRARLAAGNHNHVIERDGTDAAMAKNPLNPNIDIMKVWGVLGDLVAFHVDWSARQAVKGTLSN
jgi:hypothetical protein